MKILFENITEYNKNEVNKFQNFHAIINKPFVLYMFFLLILLIILIGVNIKEKNWNWVISVLFFGGLLFCYFKFYKSNKDKINNIRVTNKKFKFDFYDKYLTTLDVNNKNSKSDIINYFEIKKVYETEENFYLYIGENNSMVINKNNFTIGKLPDFRDFIKNKCIFRYKKRYIAKKTKNQNKKA